MTKMLSLCLGVSAGFTGGAQERAPGQPPQWLPGRAAHAGWPGARPSSCPGQCLGAILRLCLSGCASFHVWTCLHVPADSLHVPAGC